MGHPSPGGDDLGSVEWVGGAGEMRGFLPSTQHWLYFGCSAAPFSKLAGDPEARLCARSTHLPFGQDFARNDRFVGDSMMWRPAWRPREEMPGLEAA